MNKDQLRKLIYKYWNAGMNNAYWAYIKDKVEEDIEKVMKK